jgi:hypothetical protein
MKTPPTLTVRDLARVARETKVPADAPVYMMGNRPPLLAVHYVIDGREVRNDPNNNHVLLALNRVEKGKIMPTARHTERDGIQASALLYSLNLIGGGTKNDAKGLESDRPLAVMVTAPDDTSECWHIRDAFVPIGMRALVISPLSRAEVEAMGGQYQPERN